MKFQLNASQNETDVDMASFDDTIYRKQSLQCFAPFGLNLDKDDSDIWAVAEIPMITELGIFNPFWPNAPFLYPLKTSENQGFTNVIRGVYLTALKQNLINKKNC